MWRLILSIVCLLSVCCAKAQVNTEQVITIGRNALYFEDYVLSIQYFNRVIQAKPYLAQPYFYRSLAKINLEDYVGAETDASKAIELNPFITDAWEVRGVARQNLGKNKEAIDDYDHALALLPHNRQLLFNKAMAQTEVEDYDGADTTYTRILDLYPSFENARLGRARLNLARRDTVKALDDIDQALTINSKSFNAYAMRADIKIRQGSSNYKSAIADLDSALKLQPHTAGLYVNRAYLRYFLDDYFGAMSDYDYAVQLEPYNRMALFNRGLLNAEVGANDRALEDFTRVITLDPEDTRARYNRAVIYGNKHLYKEAIADVDYVIKSYPDFPSGYFMRSEFNRRAGNLTAANTDYRKAMSLNRRLKPDAKGNIEDPNANLTIEPDELARREFASLLTVEDNTDMRQEYNNTAIRGKVQDRNVSIEIEPMMELTYYASPTELKPNTYYIKEIYNLNATHALRFGIMVTNHTPTLSDQELIDKHFRSIDDYNSYLANHKPRAVDYIGRAMDFITLRNYTAAVADIDRAIALNPEFAPAYMLRAQARARLIDSGTVSDNDMQSHADDYVTRAGLKRMAVDQVIEDLDKTIALSPTNPFAWFNKGDMLINIDDYSNAELAYDKAIEIKPEFGEAYYNRGYVKLKTGRRDAGIADLSKAGELGVTAAYNLLKRISMTQ